MDFTLILKGFNGLLSYSFFGFLQEILNLIRSRLAYILRELPDRMTHCVQEIFQEDSSPRAHSKPNLTISGTTLRSEWGDPHALQGPHETQAFQSKPG